MRRGLTESREEIDTERYNGAKKHKKHQRINKEQRAVETEIDMMEVPPNRDDIVQLIKEGNEFFGDCGCGIPLTINKFLTKTGDLDYTFSCDKCSGKWTINDLING
jgi:hypothetical protein